MRLTEFAQLVLRGVFHFVVVGVPDVEEGEEVAVVVVKLPMHAIGLVLLVGGPFARVLHADGSGDDQHLGERVLLACLQQHARNRGVNGQPRHVAAEGSELLVLVEGVELAQQLETAGDGLPRGGVDKGEGLDLTQLEVDHPQDDLGEVGALDLGLGVFVAGREISF